MRRLKLGLLLCYFPGIANIAGLPTLHDSGMISGESDSFVGDLDVDFGSKADALQKLVDLPRRAGNGPKERSLLTGRSYSGCHSGSVSDRRAGRLGFGSIGE